MFNDILNELYYSFPFSQNSLKDFAIGEKNVAIVLSNGSIGVCSTLGNKIEQSAASILLNPDFNSPTHRIIVNAWINASCNYSYPITGNSDIIEAVDFTKYNSIAMVGFFGSLAKKLENQNLKITIFDLNEEDKPVAPIRSQRDSLGKSDCVIITATSLFNLTYSDLITYVKKDCDVFLLGPSTPLSPSFFRNPNIKGLFGARFKPNDYEVIKSINLGGGTRSFLNRMEKVFILNNL